jgi:hypothetical protein
MEAPCLVNLNLPSAQVPTEFLQRLLGRGHGQVGQQQPLDGVLAGWRLEFGGEESGDLDLGQRAIAPIRGRQLQAHGLDLLVDGAGGTSVAAGLIETGFGEHRGLV